MQAKWAYSCPCGFLVCRQQWLSGRCHGTHYRSRRSDREFYSVSGRGAIGYPIGTIVMLAIVDRLECRALILGSTVVWLIGMVLIAIYAGPAQIFIEAFLASAALVAYLQVAYTFTAECFPTRARSTGFAFSDGPCRRRRGCTVVAGRGSRLVVCGRFRDYCLNGSSVGTAHARRAGGDRRDLEEILS